MSPVPILLAFVAAMAVFGVWAYVAVRESLRHDVARFRAAAGHESSPLPEPRSGAVDGVELARIGEGETLLLSP
jgi:hypothetical protein